VLRGGSAPSGQVACENVTCVEDTNTVETAS